LPSLIPADDTDDGGIDEDEEAAVSSAVEDRAEDEDEEDPPPPRGAVRAKGRTPRRFVAKVRDAHDTDDVDVAPQRRLSPPPPPPVAAKAEQYAPVPHRRATAAR